MPDAASMNFLERLIAAAKTPAGAMTMATTNPLTGNIAVDPTAMAQLSPQEQQSTLTHEGVHQRQVRGRSIIERLLDAFGPQVYSYGQNPDELEAFQAEADLAQKLGRPAPTGQPNFSGGGFRTMGDILLR